jgi:hypothetical protein
MKRADIDVLEKRFPWANMRWLDAITREIDRAVKKARKRWLAKMAMTSPLRKRDTLKMKP